MTAKHQVTNDLNNLRNDATKVMQDISKLSRKLKTVTVEKAEDLSEEIRTSTLEEIETLRERLSELTAQMKVYGKAVDEHVKANPYAYVAGGVGLGYLLGKFLPSRQP